MTTSTTPPLLTPLPPAPLPTDAEALFDAKAGASLTAQAAMVGEVNTALNWQADSMAASLGYKDAAAGSAVAAANSATLAGQKVELAADQVALALTAKNAAAASANSAQTYAQAAGVSVGIPAPVADSFLGTDSSGNSLWKTVTIPPSQAIGDILFTAAPPPDGYKLADGSIYLQASYAGWMLKFGANQIAPATTKVVPSFVGSLPAGFGALKTLFSSDASTGVILGNVYVDSSTPSSQSFKRSGDVITLTGALPIGTGYNQSVVAGALSGDGTYLMTGNIGGTPGLVIEFCKRTGDAWVRLPVPITQPSTFGGQTVICSADGVYWMCGLTQGQFNIYKRTGDTLNLISTMQGANGQVPNSACAFSSDGSYLLLCFSGSPYMSIYKRSGDMFDLMPVVSPAYASYYPSAGTISADGSYIAVSGGSGNGLIQIYKLISGVYTKKQDYYDVAAITGLEFSADNQTLAYVSYYGFNLLKRLGDVWSAVPIPASAISGGGTVRAYRGNGYFNNFVCLGLSVSPYVVVYRDSYPFNPMTEFQVPFISQPMNQATSANTASNTKPSPVYAYVKLGESA